MKFFEERAVVAIIIKDTEVSLRVREVNKGTEKRFPLETIMWNKDTKKFLVSIQEEEQKQ
jgi:hypothetical protein